MKPIKIVYYEETLDNWGRKEASEKPEQILTVITDTENWSDDMKFETSTGESLFTDDLVGQTIQVGEAVFSIDDDENINWIKKV